MPTDSEPPNSGWQPATERRKRSAGGLVFVIVFLSIALGIAAIVLLANDRQNLQRLLDHLDIEWQVAVVEDPKHAPEALKGKRLKGLPVKLPANLLSLPEVNVSGVFLREMRNLGPAFCAAFNAAGIENDGWRTSPINKTGSECLSEQVVVDDADPSMNASLFFIAKGNSDGEIHSIRMKLVAPDSPAGKAMHEKTIAAVDLLIEQTGWTDLSPLLNDVQALKDHAALRFGMSYTFSREFTGPHRFNLLVLPTDKEPSAKRARDYFDQTQWLPVANPGQDLFPTRY